MQGSNSVKILANGKIKYRYYNDGQAIPKKDQTMDRVSVDQLNMSKQLKKKQLFGKLDPDRVDDLNFNDIETLTSYHDNLVPRETKSTLLRTQSLDTLFKAGTLGSLHATLKAPVVPTLEDQRNLDMAQKFTSLHREQQAGDQVKQDIENFEKRNLRKERGRYGGGISPPLYSSARTSMDDKDRSARKEQKKLNGMAANVTRMSFDDSLN